MPQEAEVGGSMETRTAEATLCYLMPYALRLTAHLPMPSALRLTTYLRCLQVETRTAEATLCYLMPYTLHLTPYA